MSTIDKKFIGANQVDDTKIDLRNDEYLRARNAADSADVNILKVNSSDQVEMAPLTVDGSINASVTATDDIAITGTFSATTHTTADGSNNTTAIQTVSTATVSAGATNDKADGLVATVSRGDGTDDGTLDSMTGLTTIIQHNSGTSGITNTSTGFDVALLTQQGTITNQYDFRSQRVPIGGTLTNHYGIYLTDDSTTPIKNWLSGTTQMGGSSFAPADSTILDLQSTTGALLVPRMDDTARDALTASNGMIIYNTTSDELQSYMGGVWTPVGGGGGGANDTLSNLSSPTAINQDLIFNSPNKSITATSQASLTGYTISLTGGETTAGGVHNGGHVNITGGAATSGNLGGNVVITGGQGDGNHGGNVTIQGGASNTAGGGTVLISGGPAVNAPGSTVTVQSGSADVDDNSGVLNLLTPAATGAGNSGNLNIQVGTVVDGVGGDLSLKLGAVSGGGSQGEFKFLKNGSPPTVGDIWTATNTDGSGYWAPGTGGGGANTSLSNLTNPTAINQNLQPNTDQGFNLGDPSFQWGSLYVQLINGADNTSIGMTGDLADNAGNLSIRWSNRALYGQSGLAVPSMGWTDTEITPFGDIIIDKTTAATFKTKDDATQASQGLSIRTGSTTGGFTTGDLDIQTGASDSGVTGAVSVRSSNTSAANANSGAASLTTGSTTGTGQSGGIDIASGNSDTLSGNTSLRTGNATAVDGNSGAVSIQTGGASGAGSSGVINIITGATDNSPSGAGQFLTGDVSAAGDSGALSVKSGNITDGNSGQVSIASGDSFASGNTGPVAIGTGGTDGGSTGPIYLSTGGNASGSNPTGNINILSGSAGGTGDSGFILLQTGTVSGGNRGYITLDALYATMPVGTSDPTAPAGSIYYNTGTNKLRLYDGSTWVDLN